MILPKGHLVEPMNFSHNIHTRTRNRNGSSSRHRIQDDWPEFDLDTEYDRLLSSTTRSRYDSHRRDPQFRSASDYETMNKIIQVKSHVTNNKVYHHPNTKSFLKHWH